MQGNCRVYRRRIANRLGGNMRDIEFRAWDKKRKKIFVPDWLDNTGNCEPYEDGGYNNPEPLNTDLPEWEWYVLMQYTGLKDKHGNKIFEGDKVRQKMPSGEIWEGPVIFTRGAFRIDTGTVFNKALIGGLAEIIGNINF